jgi:hypothetical protein
VRLALEILSITYVLVLAYLVLTHGRQSTNILNSLFRGYQGSVRVLQGR